jgi:two-component system OmpR family sensor kinase
MPASLRSRLWWSYALVIATALAMVAVILLVYIVRNPATYREANARLTLVSALIRKNETNLVALSSSDIQTRIEQVDSTYNTRVILYNAARKVIADSEQGQHPELQLPRFPRLRSYSILRDADGNYWLYMLWHLDDGRWLLLTVPRPSVPFLSILGDELMIPIVIAGGTALLISLLVALWLSRWIGNPLQQVVNASHRMPSSELTILEPRGPQEVQELARAFNKMNARVQSSQQSQRDFVANVSHELKKPLTSIQGFAQAIMDGTANTPTSRQESARIIHEEAGRMHRMVLELLDLARLDAGTLELQISTLDLGRLLKGVVEKFKPLAAEAGAAIDVKTTGLPPINGDGDRLAQVFTNLLDNAVKYTPAGGTIGVKAAQDGNSIRVEVSDTGPGIPAQALPHIFDRFYQADPSRQGGKKHGSGLGLAIAREIVASHGGKITVRSTTKTDVKDKTETGSTFIVSLPVIRENLTSRDNLKK